MTRFALIWICVFAIAVSSEEECGEEEEYYDECAPSCTGTCRAYNNSGIYHCPRCLPGCWCKEGLLKNDEGQCVAPEQCDASAIKCSGLNEEIVPCAKPCSTCGIRGNCKLKECKEGCDCKSGYYRDDSGTCIPASQCPKTGESDTSSVDDSPSSSERSARTMSSDSKTGSFDSKPDSSNLYSHSEKGAFNMLSDSDRRTSRMSFTMPPGSEDGSVYMTSDSERTASKMSSGSEKDSFKMSSDSEKSSAHLSSGSGRRNSKMFSDSENGSFTMSSDSGRSSSYGRNAFKWSSGSQSNGRPRRNWPWSLEQRKMEYFSEEDETSYEEDSATSYDTDYDVSEEFWISNEDDDEDV